jgi:hypothetical protein
MNKQMNDALETRMCGRLKCVTKEEEEENKKKNENSKEFACSCF